MKKLITLILILALILPAAACADVQKWMYEGAWTSYTYTKNGISITTIYLEENGISYCVMQTFIDNEPGVGRAFVGTWAVTGPDTINVVIGNNTSLDLQYYTYNMMYDHKTLTHYFRAILRDGDIVK